MSAAAVTVGNLQVMTFKIVGHFTKLQLHMTAHCAEECVFSDLAVRSAQAFEGMQGVLTCQSVTLLHSCFLSR